MTDNKAIISVLEAIVHSMQQAQKAGNDWRREVRLTQSAAETLLEKLRHDAAATGLNGNDTVS